MFSNIVLCLFFTGAALSAPMTSTANLRSSKVESPRNLKVAKASECTIMVASDIRILEGAWEYLEEDSFECEMDPEDMDMESGQFLPLRTSPAQLAYLNKMLKDGDLIPGESQLVHGNNVVFNSDGLYVPPGLDIETHVRRNVNKRRKLANTIGIKPILVVKVTDSGGLARDETPALIGDDIFGTITDPVNLASQMKACSFGQLDIVPGAISPSTGAEAAPGVIEVTVPISLTDNDRYAIHNAVTSAVNAKLGISLPGPYEQVMYVIEKCYVNCGYAAYAYVNSWMSVYVDRYYMQVGVQMHELGHSFNLAHSGGLDGATYTDHTGLMGNPLYSDDVGKMCFNAAKNWQLNWYNDKKLLVNPRVNPTTIVDLVGIANYDTTANSHPVVVKIETGTITDQFIGFNRAVGINAQNDEADNEVTIVQTGNNGENYSQSVLKAHLVQGESYSFPNWDNNGHALIITALDIDLGVNQDVDIAVARVSITLEGVPTQAPVTSAPTNAAVTSAPTKTPSNAPVTSAPTNAPVTATPTKAPVTATPTTASITSAPTKAPVTATPTKAPSAPTRAPVQCSSLTDRGGNDCKDATGCSWIKKEKICIPDSAADSEPTVCSSLTDRGGNDCKDATGCSGSKRRKSVFLILLLTVNRQCAIRTQTKDRRHAELSLDAPGLEASAFRH